MTYKEEMKMLATDIVKSKGHKVFLNWSQKKKNVSDLVSSLSGKISQGNKKEELEIKKTARDSFEQLTFEFTNRSVPANIISNKLLEKIELTKSILLDFTSKNDSYLSFSGGKDSTVLYYILKSLDIEIPIVFCNTTNEDKDVLKYVKKFPKILTIYPKINFTNILKRYGFPLVSKDVAQKLREIKNTKSEKLKNKRLHGDYKGNGKLPVKWRYLIDKEFEVTERCCYHLKKAPFTKYEKETSRKPIVALMSSESSLRYQLSLRDDLNIKKCYPLMHWTDKDIWEYAKFNKIRFAECYYANKEKGLTAETRTGCIGCAFGVHLEENNRFDNQMIKNPKRMSKLLNTKNNGVSFIDAINLVR
jgi:3'-phosphoadenosine 5'-phosphosulfate sulfotransferase (PAPS reductase)/FAD synthetase